MAIKYLLDEQARNPVFEKTGFLKPTPYTLDPTP